eukprot:1176116-Rhodomonas_salina.1
MALNFLRQLRVPHQSGTKVPAVGIPTEVVLVVVVVAGAVVEGGVKDKRRASMDEWRSMPSLTRK